MNVLLMFQCQPPPLRVNFAISSEQNTPKNGLSRY